MTHRKRMLRSEAREPIQVNSTGLHARMVRITDLAKVKTMTKPILLLLCLSVPTYAADTPVQILDTFNLQQAQHWNGVITVSWPAFTASGGTSVAKGTRDYTVTDGAVNISLYSTVGASPSFLYTANFRTTDAQNRGLTFRQTWYVPASGPVTLRDVVRASTLGTGLAYVGPWAGRVTSPHTNDLILVTDAGSAGVCNTSGGTSYALCAWSGTAWVAASGSGGGGGGGVWGTITGTLANQSDLQTALNGRASLTGNYSNPDWIQTLAWSKITGVPSFESPLSFNAPFSRATNTISIAACETDGFLLKYRTSTGWGCETDETGAGGVASLNGLTGSTQTFGTANDTNVTISVSSAGTTHSLILGWTGTLAKGRQHSATAYTDAANTFATGTQDFSGASHLRIPVAAGYTPSATGHIGYDSSANSYKGYVSSSVKTFAFTDDSRFTDSRTPTAHASTHASAGSDAVSPASIGAVATTRTVAGHALSSDVTLSSSDVGLGSVPNVDATVATNISSGTLADARLSTTNRTRVFGYSFNGGATALSAGQTGYLTIPYACTIQGWNISVDTGTATVDIWKAATGTAIPTVSNTITASAIPAISTGTSVHSTTLTGWTTSVSANDIIGINLKIVSSATFVNLTVECRQ